MSPRAWLVAAFPEGDTGGNPAGVVLDADTLHTAQRQAIAARIGVSETAFVSRSATATARLEFFTPNRQIAHCGHATVAAFGLLHAHGHLGDGLHRKETIDGEREVRIDRGEIAMSQRAPRFIAIDADTQAATLAALGLREDALAGLPPQVVDTGNRFLHLGLRDRAALAALAHDADAVHRLSDRLDLIGVYIHTRDAARPERHAAARMFAPRYAIAEEAATGMAAGGLGALLHAHGLRVPELRFEQGHLMPEPSPSLLRVRVEGDGDAIAKVWAGGHVRVVRDLGAVAA